MTDLWTLVAAWVRSVGLSGEQPYQRRIIAGEMDQIAAPPKVGRI